MLATLQVFGNERWRQIFSNLIWRTGKEKCARALYCFGDGQICPRKKWLGASKMSPYLQRVQALRDNIPTSLVLTQLSDGETRTKRSKIFPGKQLKLSKDIRRRKRLGEVREVKHSGAAAFWSGVVFGFNPATTPEHAAAHYEVWEIFHALWLCCCRVITHKSRCVLCVCQRQLKLYLYKLSAIKPSNYQSINVKNVANQI